MLAFLQMCIICSTFATELIMNAYELAYEYVQHTNRCIFLTGKAGTGKTTFLRRLKTETLKQMTVVAPTGVAAINAEGVTIHSLFQLPPQLFLPTPEARNKLFSEMQMRSHKQRVLRNLELLVIDEVSMVRADLLDTIDAVLRHFKHRPNIPFGGAQVLFIGDLFQLSPVAREDEWRLLSDYYEGPYFFQAQVFRELQPVYIELDHVFRQTNMAFVEILNQVRNNALTPEARMTLNSRYNPYFKADKKGEHYITLSTHNSKVDAINQRELEALKGDIYTYQARVKDTFPESMYPIDKTLMLKVGAKVMFVKNDSEPEKLYYNGKLGTVTALSKTEIHVLCEDGTEVEVHTETWENLRYTSETGSDQVQVEVIGSFTHFPLRLAWAITIHKAQGLTFDHVVIDAEDAFPLDKCMWHYRVAVRWRV
jgi:ATP-dependent exoDNAse (exonuclease V) alpha subunit